MALESSTLWAIGIAVVAATAGAAAPAIFRHRPLVALWIVAASVPIGLKIVWLRLQADANDWEGGFAIALAYLAVFWISITLISGSIVLLIRYLRSRRGHD